MHSSAHIFIMIHLSYIKSSQVSKLNLFIIAFINWAIIFHIYHLIHHPGINKLSSHSSAWYSFFITAVIRAVLIYTFIIVFSIQYVGWSVEFFFIKQNRSSNQRSSMILEVQIRSFGAWARTSKF